MRYIPDIKSLKNKYKIVGNDEELSRSLSVAVQVAPTDMSILIMGESGVGKDVFSKIIHENSSRKHGKIVSVNCGAIPEGTIESELFGHVKGAFTSADKDRKGYFEEADKSTIFLDEVGELPLSMQAKLLRVLESGEMMRVGSSTVKKVDVRVIAATNVDMIKAVREGKFREDLYFRLNQISIHIPPLRARKDDIGLLFKRFALDIADRYRMDPISLTDDALDYLKSYPWYGNIRELKNVTEQMSVIETERVITKDMAMKYLYYDENAKLPVLYQQPTVQNQQSVELSLASSAITDRELLLKALSMGQMIKEMKEEINELKKTLLILTSRQQVKPLDDSAEDADNANLSSSDDNTVIDKLLPYEGWHYAPSAKKDSVKRLGKHTFDAEYINDDAAEELLEVTSIDADVTSYEEPLSLEEREIVAIKKALEKNGGNRRKAAKDLRIAERTLYRKLKSYGLD